MSRRAFVLGGTGQIGRAVAGDLIEQGWRVTVAHRGTHPLPSDSSVVWRLSSLTATSPAS
jgi:uncharacterized protein YbjT (DUF2867 family)